MATIYDFLNKRLYRKDGLRDEDLKTITNITNSDNSVNPQNLTEGNIYSPVTFNSNVIFTTEDGDTFNITEITAATEKKSACIVSFGSGTAVATGDGTTALTIPVQLSGMNLTDVVCSVHTKGVTGATDVQIRRRRGGSNADMLTTKITIGDEFFASDEGINASNDDVVTGDQIYVDVDAVHTTPPNGLSTVLTFQTP